ncbi:hypothetical protein BASA60_007847 [Batrachochytrium salamandrivorans]|nr:hypothetical protein BASA60_007847 [Batrachochytrium salamandrivorans]KAH6573452.1 hypothetical protein BASA62_002979 [Batrachochytrium salamandrivorans]KAH9274584.1 hypothetical protein BASA83_003220 [Batrachochytrium salamandrivorans]
MAVPNGIRGFDLIYKLKESVRPTKVRRILAVGNVSRIQESQRVDLQNAGVELHDCASPKPSASDMTIVVEMLKFVYFNPPPAPICLLSSDSDFSKVLNFLSSVSYEVVVIHSSNVSSALLQAASRTITWESIVSTLPRSNSAVSRSYVQPISRVSVSPPKIRHPRSKETAPSPASHRRPYQHSHPCTPAKPHHKSKPPHVKEGTELKNSAIDVHTSSATYTSNTINPVAIKTDGMSFSKLIYPPLPPSKLYTEHAGVSALHSSTPSTPIRSTGSAGSSLDKEPKKHTTSMTASNILRKSRRPINPQGNNNTNDRKHKSSSRSSKNGSNAISKDSYAYNMDIFDEMDSFAHAMSNSSLGTLKDSSDSTSTESVQTQASPHAHHNG